MKHNRIAAIAMMVVMILAVSLTAICQTPNQSLKFDERGFDFGTIKEEGGKVTHRFRFTNVGKTPVTILRVNTGCNCVKATYPTDPIEPGKSDYIDVTFNPENRSGDFRKEINIITPDRQFNRVYVRGSVKAAKKTRPSVYRHDFGHGLMMTDESFTLRHLKPGQSKSVTLRFINTFPIVAHLTFEVENPQTGVEVEIPSSHILRPDEEASMPVTVTLGKRITTPVTINLIPVINSYRLAPIPITIR